MKLSELRDVVNKTCEGNPHKLDATVGVAVVPSGMAGTSIVEIKFAGLGFDWDAGKFMLYPVVPVTKKK